MGSISAPTTNQLNLCFYLKCFNLIYYLKKIYVHEHQVHWLGSPPLSSATSCPWLINSGLNTCRLFYFVFKTLATFISLNQNKKKLSRFKFFCVCFLLTFLFGRMNNGWNNSHPEGQWCYETECLAPAHTEEYLGKNQPTNQNMKYEWMWRINLKKWVEISYTATYYATDRSKFSKGNQPKQLGIVLTSCFVNDTGPSQGGC